MLDMLAPRQKQVESRPGGAERVVVSFSRDGSMIVRVAGQGSQVILTNQHFPLPPVKGYKDVTSELTD
jgi:hypothetical protein